MLKEVNNNYKVYMHSSLGCKQTDMNGKFHSLSYHTFRSNKRWPPPGGHPLQTVPWNPEGADGYGCPHLG